MSLKKVITKFSVITCTTSTLSFKSIISFYLCGQGKKKPNSFVLKLFHDGKLAEHCHRKLLFFLKKSVYY